MNNNQPGYYYPVYPTNTNYQNYHRQLQPVNPTLLSQSASESTKLLNDVITVLDTIKDSSDFDTALMNAAQNSNYDEVNRLINSLRIKSKVKIKFDPHGIQMEFQSRDETLNISSITIALRWR